MAQGKVEICGVNTAKLPILNEEEKEALFVRIKAGDQEAKEEYIKGNKIKNKIENAYTFDSLNKKTIVDVLKDFLTLNSKSETGRALKVYDVTTENLTYGCWIEGLYNYKGYYKNGAPSDWAGAMLVKQNINSSGEVDGFVKTVFSAECKIYMMRQNKNGDIEQSWKEV